MLPFVAVISPVRAMLVPNTAAPSNWDAHHLRIGYDPGIDRGVDMRDAQTPLVVDFHFDHGRHIGQEAAVHGDTHAPSLADFFFPSWLCPPPAARRASVAPCRTDTLFANVRGGCFSIDRVPGPDQCQQVIVGSRPAAYASSFAKDCTAKA